MWNLLIEMTRLFQEGESGLKPDSLLMYMDIGSALRDWSFNILEGHWVEIFQKSIFFLRIKIFCRPPSTVHKFFVDTLLSWSWFLCSKLILSCLMQKCYLFPKVPLDPLPPTILYGYKIANLLKLLISSLNPGPDRFSEWNLNSNPITIEVGWTNLYILQLEIQGSKTMKLFVILLESRRTPYIIYEPVFIIGWYMACIWLVNYVFP